MAYSEHILQQAHESSLDQNKVLKNTYLLLSLTLLCSALTAAWAMKINAAPVSPLILLIGYFGLLFLTSSLRNSVWGLASIFALTGFMGYTLGPIINYYIHAFTNGSQIVMTAFGATSVIFLTLSSYALITKKDFSYLGAFLSVGIMVAFIGGLISLFFNFPILDLLVSMAFVLLSSGLILFQTSLIIHGGERNYIMATITLYIAIYNLFLSLLRVLSFFSGDRS